MGAGTPRGEFPRDRGSLQWNGVMVPDLPAMKLLSLVLLSIALLVAPVYSAAPAKEKFSFGPWEKEIGYTQAVRVGNVLYISGSTGSGAMPDAIKEAFGAIRQCLEHYKLGFTNVVKETIYTTDIEALKLNKEVRKAFYADDFPAATWIQISRLYDPQHVIEVEVIAVFPDTAVGSSGMPVK